MESAEAADNVCTNLQGTVVGSEALTVLLLEAVETPDVQDTLKGAT
jgi:hypothetical protein